MFWRMMVAIGLLSILSMAVNTLRGDEFDRIGGDSLRECLREQGTKQHAALSFRELEAMPSVLRDTRSALLLVRTDQGNLARLLVSPGFRKRPPSEARDVAGAPGRLVPTVVIERFEVFDGGNPSSRLARGRDLMLFGGFQLDLDSGQVVPEALGGDISFTARGPDDGIIAGVGPVRLATLEKPPTVLAAAASAPSEGRVVRPGDVAGQFRLIANGQWTGRLELAVDPAGVVSGKFQSDASGSSYTVTGQVDPVKPRKTQFSIQFPRTRQDYQGILWTEGKQVMTGRMSMLDQEFGFMAIREGARLDIEGVQTTTSLHAAGNLSNATVWLRVRVEPEANRYLLDRQPRSQQELAHALRRAAGSTPTVKVLVQAAETVPYQRIRQTLDLIHAAGIQNVRLAPAVDDP
jgi:biopolymer transport protein ExbD